MKTILMLKLKKLLAVPVSLLLTWPLLQCNWLIAEMFLIGSAGWIIATSLLFLGAGLVLRRSRVRPQEQQERDPQEPVSIGGWLLTHHWIWLGALVGISWRFGGRISMVQIVLALVAILVSVEFLTWLLRLRGKHGGRLRVLATGLSSSRPVH